MPKGKVKLVMPEFDRIPVSTKTVIGLSSSTYNIQSLFEKLPIVDYKVVPKRRGRKKSRPIEDPNKDLASGSIVTLKFFEHVRGVDLKPRKKAGKYFRNALSVVMKVEDKLVNFKLSKNGKFQMTGVKRDEHSVKCIEHLWEHILSLEDHTLYSAESRVKVVIKVVMTNIDFSLGFLVNRENLDSYFNRTTEFNSLLETSFGYTGVNIKFPIQGDIYDELDTRVLDINTETWTNEVTSYSDYLDLLSAEDRRKEVSKQRYNTFLVFHSGNVIMSGPHKGQMIAPYQNFLDIIRRCKPDIEEQLCE